MSKEQLLELASELALEHKNPVALAAVRRSTADGCFAFVDSAERWLEQLDGCYARGLLRRLRPGCQQAADAKDEGQKSRELLLQLLHREPARVFDAAVELKYQVDSDEHKFESAFRVWWTLPVGHYFDVRVSLRDFQRRFDKRQRAVARLVGKTLVDERLLRLDLALVAGSRPLAQQLFFLDTPQPATEPVYSFLVKRMSATHLAGGQDAWSEETRSWSPGDARVVVTPVRVVRPSSFQSLMLSQMNEWHVDINPSMGVELAESTRCPALLFVVEALAGAAVLGRLVLDYLGYAEVADLSRPLSLYMQLEDLWRGGVRQDEVPVSCHYRCWNWNLLYTPERLDCGQPSVAARSVYSAFGERPRLSPSTAQA